MELNEIEKDLVERLAEALAEANEQIGKAQIARYLSSYAEGLKTGITIEPAQPQATAV